MRASELSLPRRQVEVVRGDPLVVHDESRFVPEANQHLDGGIDVGHSLLEFNEENGMVPRHRLDGASQYRPFMSFDVDLDEAHISEPHVVDSAGTNRMGTGPTHTRNDGCGPFRSDAQILKDQLRRSFDVRYGALMDGDVARDTPPKNFRHLRIRFEGLHIANSFGQPVGPRPVPGSNIDGGAGRVATIDDSSHLRFSAQVQSSDDGMEQRLRHDLGRGGQDPGQYPTFVLARFLSHQEWCLGIDRVPPTGEQRGVYGNQTLRYRTPRRRGDHPWGEPSAGWLLRHYDRDVGAELSIVIPMFNEARALPSTIEELSRRFAAHRTEIFLVDDGSTDDSAGLAEFLTRELDHIEIIRLPRNLGKGAALRAGVARTSASVVLFMDADLSASLDSIDAFLARTDTFDVVIGSRSVPGSVVKRSNLLRQLMGRTFNRLMRLMTGLPVHDSQCGFKAFRGDVARLLFHLSRNNRFAFDPEILRIAEALDYSIDEVPVTWIASEYSAVRPVRDSLRTAWDLLPIRLRTRRRRIEDLASRCGLPVPPPALPTTSR